MVKREWEMVREVEEKTFIIIFGIPQTHAHAPNHSHTPSHRKHTHTHTHKPTHRPTPTNPPKHVRAHARMYKNENMCMEEIAKGIQRLIT